MQKRRRFYTEREREFYDAKRAVQSGKVVLAEFADGSRQIVNGLRMHERKPYVLTMAGRSFEYKCLLTFSTVTAAIEAMYANRNATV